MTKYVRPQFLQYCVCKVFKIQIHQVWDAFRDLILLQKKVKLMQLNLLPTCFWLWWRCYKHGKVVEDYLVSLMNNQKIIEEKLYRQAFKQPSMSFMNPEVSRPVIYKMATERLVYWKVCIHWVPKMLTDNLKKNRVATVQEFLIYYANQDDNFLDPTMTWKHTLEEVKHEYLTTQWE